MDFILDDENLTQTKELTQTVFTLQRFYDCYCRTIQAWEDFEREDIHIFDLVGQDTLQSGWKAHLSNIRGQVSDLRSCTTRLRQHLKLFNGMKKGVSYTQWYMMTVD